jgi:hypothetical protein
VPLFLLTFLYRTLFFLRIVTTFSIQIIMARTKFPALREGDYWSEVINDKAIFNGFYLGYAFELTYSFASKKWEKEKHQSPDEVLKLLKWELHNYELWLPDEEPPPAL